MKGYRLGTWPSTPEADEEGQVAGRSPVQDPSSNSHRLERLIHLELADHAVNAPYLHPEFPHVRESDVSGYRLVQARAACIDCEHLPTSCAVICASLTSWTIGDVAHKEIFTFRRPEEGRYSKGIWEEIVKPIIEKWTKHVNTYT